jgi:hypothetical protein
MDYWGLQKEKKQQGEKAMKYCRRRNKGGIEGLMIEGEWQEPGVVLKDGSVGQWSICRRRSKWGWRD